MHAIRLRGPWRKRREGESRETRISVPESDPEVCGPEVCGPEVCGPEVCGPEVCGPEVCDPESSDTGATGALATFHYRRDFNRPSGLVSTTKIFLRVDRWRGRLESVHLNDARWQTNDALWQPNGSSARIDVTECLLAHNRLELRLVSLPGQPAALSGPVTLAIEEEAVDTSSDKPQSTV